MMLLDKASLPHQAYEAKQVQENEPKVAKQAAISMYDLMETAGEALFHWLSSHYKNTQPVLILCGKGNNGGDGYVLARLALAAGFPVHIMVIASSSDIKGDAYNALKQLQTHVDFAVTTDTHSLTFLDEEDFFTQLLKHFLYHFTLNNKPCVVVDALFGIGFKGDLSPWVKHIVKMVNAAHLPVLSVDIPSGLSADTGRVHPMAIKASTTITFIAMKKGLLTGVSANYVGKLLLADLGVGQTFQHMVTSNIYLQNSRNLPELKAREPASHKGHIGHAVCVGGNSGFPGAIRLSAEMALRAGASLVSVTCHKHSRALVFNGRPELMLAASKPSQANVTHLLAKAKVIILGPGLGNDAWAESWFTQLVSDERPKVVDADALKLLSKTTCSHKNWVLTPHPGEAASLLHCDIASVEGDRFSAVKSIAQQYGGICVLKGSGTLISDGRAIWVNTTGNAGMASGGMGDVLSGLIGALMMQIPDNLQASRLAVYIHGRAADILAQKEGMNGMLASDLLPIIRRLLNEHVNQEI